MQYMHKGGSRSRSANPNRGENRSGSHDIPPWRRANSSSQPDGDARTGHPNRWKNKSGSGNRSWKERADRKYEDGNQESTSANGKIPGLTGLDGLSQIFDDKSNDGNDPSLGYGRARGRGRGRGSSRGSSRGGHTENNAVNMKGPRRIGFKKLEEFLNEEPDQLLINLLNASSGFSELINSPDLSADYIVLVMKVLSKMNESTFTSNKTKIIQTATPNEFVLQLTKFIMFLPLQTYIDKRNSRYFWNDPNSFFKCLCSYCDMIFTLSPTVAMEVLAKLIKAAVIIMPQVEALSDETKEMMETMQEKLFIFEEQLKEKYKKKTAIVDESECEPPDDFRTMSLYPLPIEITNRTKAFVRKNIIEGPYKNVEHYLDVQFRLLREDFVKPLREGICDYRENSKKKAQNIKVYKNVKFLSPYMVNAVCGVLIQLDIKDNKMFKRKLENSRRFMFGSLICFTVDNFRSVIFGKIIDRKLELLQKGQLVIEFESGVYEIDYDANYLMVESSVYFEPYYHVLRALQQLNEETFPMKKYIIEVNHKKEPPRYLAPSSPNTSDSEFDYDEIVMAVKKPRIVQNTDRTVHLNEAQYEAYQSAMNQSFSIIQGPPGTGKTFLGLVVAKSLIQKQAEWYHERYPLLVVCFTNHALDQFLEGLLPVTRDIVRVGGQSKNKSLEAYNLRNCRRTADRRTTRAFYEARDAVQLAHNMLKRAHDSLESTNQFDGIVNILQTVRTLPEIFGSWFETVEKKEFADWLLGGITHNQRRQATLEMEQKMNTDDNKDAESETELMDDLLNDPNEVNFLNIDDIFSSVTDIGSMYIVSTKEMETQIRALYERRSKMGELNDDNYGEIVTTENEIQKLEIMLEYLKMRMEEGKNTKEFLLEDFVDFDEPHGILPNLRWNLYFYWLEKHRAVKKEYIEECEKQYQNCYQAYEELREIEDIALMRHKLVVGMTTTGAARLRGSLRALKSPIVIVEEAAEIMESHVVTALTEHCTHLILIGDHQQLRPNTADYTMEKQYYLGISLFERMVRNNIHCSVLNVQHRMRPDIAKLIAPSIYPQLENHTSVHDFPPVRGIDPTLYFIDHQHPEEQCADQSKSNLHEVKFLLRLAQYLLLNGYEPEDITIVAAYSGQMFAMMRERKNFEMLRTVRITVLDNYQGEESKIILLSLVRNNADGKIGFLSLENRVCVALSRAREGMYIMGNMDLLCANSKIWPKVRNVLEEQNSLGSSLALRCQIHHDRVTTVATENDFLKVPEGGCNLVCNVELVCGHKCKSLCHILKRDHAEYKCMEKCTSNLHCFRILCGEGHICPKLCFKDCGNCEVPMLRKFECGHEVYFPCSQTELLCEYPVTVELPCTHKVSNKPCYRDVETFPCPHPCDTRIDTCGHACDKRCHIRNDPDHLEYKCVKPCSEFRKNCSMKIPEHVCPNRCFEECPDCEIIVKKKRSCSHVYNTKCCVDVETVSCEKPCKKILPCGHQCKSKCYQQCEDCKTKVKKIIQKCGHEVMIECSKTPTVLNCKQNCVQLLSCGHHCKNKCNEACTNKCEELVDSVALLPCGHSSTIPCFMNTTEYIRQDENAETVIKYCKQPCNVKLECGHNCLGSCGACYQGRIHKTCSENCDVDLVCGHKCKVPCRQVCPPCFAPCLYRCTHSKCKKKCGEICTPCKEYCPRRCKHVRCTARCSAKCTVQPCTEPCPRQLRCRHDCIGFCGEPCPPLCRICNRDELMEVYLGYEDEEDARFVLLQECNHVIESRGMDMWLENGGQEITIKRCPRCRMPLTVTRRYNDYIKASIEEIQTVKVKFFGGNKENAAAQTELQNQLRKISSNSDLLRINTSAYTETHNKIQNMLKPARNSRRQTLSKIQCQILRSKIQILDEISSLYKEASHPKFRNAIVYIDFLLRRLVENEQRMTGQEVNDYTTELKRLRRILQLSTIVEKCPSAQVKSIYISLKEKLFSFKVYNVNDDGKIKQDLDNLAKQLDGTLIITDKEMRDIVKAIGVRQGAWYKCPNGHPYAIGECGGAMQVSKCADCGVQIGGTNHALLSNNAHFNIDGSRYAAWSEQANMGNYDLD
ncbi:dna2/nam7 helicase family [Holotrichia oblita]|uniref:Dna2/nam7 helicase family n=1 Tax=Holotrichia oblita TaxID=644536 RepID=A0ACB9TVN7_HOLOL|nr:dna2/nam7 helicase family [Holotrichia oblita]